MAPADQIINVVKRGSRGKEILFTTLII